MLEKHFYLTMSYEKEGGLSHWVIASLSLCTSALLACQTSLPDQQNTCDKRNKVAFRSCIENTFTVGSNYSNLEHFLLEQGFKRSKHPDHLERGKFSFFWWANDIGNYKIAVTGRYDSASKITEIDVL
jgi:hypothetical protein